MAQKIVIGSRGSDLALWQAEHIKSLLKEECGIVATIKVIKTKGDKIQDLSFDKLEGKGFFTKEIEQALLDKEIDLAVHSMKDLQTTMPDGLVIAAVPKRANQRDLIIMRKEAFEGGVHLSLKEGAVVGTSSARRKTQLLLRRPDIEIKDLRGNVPTRIQKLRDGEYDAIVLAEAGVDRLAIDLSEFEQESLNSVRVVPAAGQGALALQMREEDEELITALEDLGDYTTETAVETERRILAELGGGCQQPIGVYAKRKGIKWRLYISVAKDMESLPRRYYGVKDKVNQFNIEDVNKILGLEFPGKRVFVSRSPDEMPVFSRLLEDRGVVVEGLSLIQTISVPFMVRQQVDWVFFSSRQAVNHFFDHMGQMSSNVFIGATGPGTAMAIEKRGLKVSFKGEDGNIVQVGQEFAKLVKGKKVLFPQSKIGRKTVQSQLHESSEAIDLTVYDTRQVDHTFMNQVDVVVLTSPSNAINFLEQYSFPKKQLKFVSIGGTTGNLLRQKGITDIVEASEPSEIGLADGVVNALAGKA